MRDERTGREVAKALWKASVGLSIVAMYCLGAWYGIFRHDFLQGIFWLVMGIFAQDNHNHRYEVDNE